MSTTITAGTTIGLWTVVEVTDPRRALCECRCGNLRAVFVASLLDGSSVSCGCGMPLTKQQIDARRSAGKRSRLQRDLKDWRPRS